MSETKLIQGCLQNDRTCQKKLYDQYSGQMYSICLRYCRCETIAADALQNAFIRVFKHLDSFRNEGDLGAWIRRIVVRSSLDQIKTEKKYATSDIDDIKYDAYDSVVVHDSMTYDALLKLLDQLPTGYRTVFSMSVLDELNHKEISDILHISEATSRTQLLKARKYLQQLISQSANLYV